VASSTLCTTAGLDTTQLMPASQVGAFSTYGWGDQPVLINRTTASAAVPSPIAGGQCPCRAGWGGGTCSNDQNCGPNGQFINGACSCYVCQVDENYGGPLTYGWRGARCDQRYCTAGRGASESCSSVPWSNALTWGAATCRLGTA
jgi:hypothetical protein